MKTYIPLAGENVSETAKRMVALAKKTKEPVTAEFNKIKLTAKPGTDPDSIVKYYQTESSRRHEKYVNSPEYKRREREAEEAQQRQDLALKGALAFAPSEMTFRDKDAWEKTVAANTDGYGSGVISFAERWARLMEGRMANGDTLEACAKEASLLANNEGITGFMYGCAVSILSKVWIHGEQLRRWHNLETQIGNEGEKANAGDGVLNPALLSFSSP